MKALLRHTLVTVVCLGLGLSGYAQNSANQASSRSNSSMSGEFGLGVKVGLLGVGGEVAARVNRHSNVRAGFNVLGYSRTFNKDGISYDGHLDFRTIEAHYDVFPFAGKFHISGGMLDYIGNPITANALVAGDKNFTLGGVTYYSDPAVPAAASGRVNFNQISPTVTFGWGNLVRENHHFSFPIELGVAFQGSPKSTLGLSGQVCNQPSTNPIGRVCTPTSDPTVQSNVVAEQTKLNTSMKPFKYYPIISFGFGYKF